jgi:SAM-dependent methyltransferase
VPAVLGVAAGLLAVPGPASADLVLCHGVLEHVDDVAPAVAALAAVLRPDGALSVLAAHRNAVVVARAAAGRFAEARHALADPDGRWGPGDPMPRRFTEAGLVDLLAAAGLRVGEVHGVRTVADLVPGGLVDHDPDAADALVELELATAHLPEFRAVASQLHVLATKA